MSQANPTREDFAALLQESFAANDLAEGYVAKGIVTAIEKDVAIVDVGLKVEGRVPLKEFGAKSKDGTLKVGDEVEVYVERIENALGEAVLSREKARREESWAKLEVKFEAGERVEGVIFNQVKGGFTVDLDGAVAFLPRSQVDIRPIRDVTPLMHNPQPFEILKMDKRRGNIVVSRRTVLEESRAEQRSEIVQNLEEGQVVDGVVKNITDYGAFVDLGGIDGLLHITDMAWKRVRHPSEVVEVGQELDVRVLKYDRERNRVSLGLKQLGEDPWDNIARRYPSNCRVFGKVSNVTDYGAFVEIEPGVEGLVHVSEMDWTNKNVNPAKVVQVGDELEVMVLDVDEERRRISLGIKQVTSNPWETFAAIHKKGDKVSGQIKSITDFGIFIGLDGGIDGLIHLSDISWNSTGEEIARNYKKGDTLEAVVLAVDPERERISLGVKQMEQDPLGQFMAANPKGTKVKGTVKEVDAKGAVIDLGEGVEGYVSVRDISHERTEDASQALKVGQEVEAKFVGMDRKGRSLQLSIKDKDAAETAEALAEYNKAHADAASGTTKLGALLREQLNSKAD